MNVLMQFIYSLYSPKTIATFYNQKVGKTIFYVLMLMFLTFVTTGYQISSAFLTIVNEVEETVQNDIKSFELKEGILTSSANEPFVKQYESFTVVFDTTGQVKLVDVEQYDDALAILDKEIILVSQGTVDTIHYSELGDLQLTDNDLTSFLNYSPLIISIVIFILYVLMTAKKFIGIFFLSFIGLFAKKIFSVSLSYKQVWILSAYSVTLPTVFFAITNSFGLNIPFSFGIYWMTAIVMLYTTFKEVSLFIKNNEIKE